MHSPQDTIAAIATPLGEGGLGVIRISGAHALEIISALFKSSTTKTLLDAPSHSCHVGMIEDIDQSVVTLFRAPHSYTGEDVVEISAHGSPLGLQKILNLCLLRGARLAGPGEFTERAFLNGKMDLTQAEAVAELISAKTDKSQRAAFAQLRGGLARKVRALRDTLLPMLAHVEVNLDHSDEDHDFLSRQRLVDQCAAIHAEMVEVLKSARVSKILRDGLRVALVGRPNVGKSSLLNALLKEDRAIVTAIPGTTRDTLEERVSLNGIPIVLTDTAGLRSGSEDPVERLGMERTRESLDRSDLVIGLFDNGEPLSTEDEGVIRQAMLRPHVWVINKSDLPTRFSTESLHAMNGLAPVVRVSAKTGEGLDTLAKALTDFALAEKAPTAEAEWLLNARHQAALERAQEALSRAGEAAKADAYEECVALELQTALQTLGEIIGETTSEELLGQIFSQFCIGK